MRETHWFGLTYVVLVCASCATSPPGVRDLPVPAERIACDGYSLVPPNEPGWAIAEVPGYQLNLGKRGDKPDETNVIMATLFRMPQYRSGDEFRQVIKEGQAVDTDPDRFNIIKHEVVDFSGKATDCARSHVVSEDKAPASGKNMILEDMTLVCAHPEDKAVGVNVTYSERYYPGDRDTKFIEKALAVLRTVEFTDL